MNAWPTVPIRRVARLGSGHTPSRQVAEYWENCTVPWLTLADVGQLRDGTVTRVDETKERISELGIANSSAEIHPAGTVAMSRTASIGFTCVLGTEMATSQDFATWTCGDLAVPRYLLWALRGTMPAILSRTQGSTHKTIYMPDIEQLAVPLPPVRAQRAIADFLDAETARIDALIAKKRRLSLLAAERLGLQIRATLRGDPFKLVPLKRRWQVIDCKHRTPQYQDVGYPVVSPGDVTAGRLDLSRAHRFVNREDLADLTSGGRRARRGDIIYSRNASIGIASFVDTDDPFTMGQDVCLITSREEDQLFLTYVLNTVGVDQLDVEKVGSTFSRVNISQILEIEVPYLGPDEQRRYAELFDAWTARTDRLRHTLHRQIALLHERRQALITAAVTGELEVPGAA